MTAISSPLPTSAAAFVAQCHRQGIRLAVVGGKIKASGSPPPKPETFAALLKAYKPEILEILAAGGFATAKNPEKPDASGRPVLRPVEAPTPSDEADVPRNLADSRRISQVDYFSPESDWLDRHVEQLAQEIQAAEGDAQRALRAKAGRMRRLVEQCREAEASGDAAQLAPLVSLLIATATA